MLFIAYSTQTLVGHAHGPVSWKDLAYILPR